MKIVLMIFYYNSVIPRQELRRRLWMAPKEFTFSKVLKFFCGHEVLKLYFSGQKIHVFEILEHKNTCFLIRNLNFWSRIVILIFWRSQCSRPLRPYIKWNHLWSFMGFLKANFELLTMYFSMKNVKFCSKLFILNFWILVNEAFIKTCQALFPRDHFKGLACKGSFYSGRK